MEILSHTIACSYFFKATFLRINDYDMELDGAARDIGTVISAMRMREGNLKKFSYFSSFI